MDLPPLEAVRSLASRFQTPTNAIAVAALDSFSQPGAEQAIGEGMSEEVARSFLGPDGIFPRMRLLAWGWEKKGDKFRPVSDRAWWRARYKFPLWDPVITYIDQATQAGIAPPIVWDEELASGDAAELGRTLSAVVQSDLPPVDSEPCPKWLIPPGRGMLPIPNPKCLPKQPIRDEVEKVHRPGRDWTWLLWLGVAYLIYDSRDGR